MKLTYGTIKSRAAKVLNLNSSDARVLSYVNAAQERLLYDAGKSVDTLVRYAVCVTDGCIVWPRDIETIEAWEQCGIPGTVRNHFYEFLGYGPGTMSAGNGSGGRLIDRGNAVAFDEVVGTGKKLAVWADSVESAGLKLLVRYYDGNANKVYTLIDGTYQEGEEITLIPGTYAYSLSTVMQGGLYEVLKPVTKKPIRLYEFTPASADVIGAEGGEVIGTGGGDDIGTGPASGGTYRALAYYEPDETLPTYRRSLIPCLASGAGGCSTQRITVLAKRRFIPAINDDSVLIISHADAVRLACQAIKKEEDVGVVEAEPLWQMAIRCLDRQLRHYQGDGVAAPINFAGMDSPIYNLV